MRAWSEPQRSLPKDVMFQLQPGLAAVATSRLERRGRLIPVPLEHLVMIEPPALDHWHQLWRRDVK